MSAARSARTLPPREKILRAARRLLAERGHERLSLRAVARGARFAPSSLYEHFSDRRALLEALARDTLAELRAAMTAACAADVPSAERLLGAAMAFLEFAARQPNQFWLCFSRPQPASMTEPPPESPLLPVVGEIARGLASGELLAPPGLGPLDMAVSLWTQTHGMAVLRLAYLSQLPNFEERARRIVLASISTWRRPSDVWA